MAVQGRGYYGIGTARKDFGFSSNMTLPLAGGYNLAQAGGMPQERHSGKGHASFAVEKERKAETSTRKGKSWKNRLSGFFKKSKKEERETVEKGAANITEDKVKARPKESSLPKKAASDKATAPEDDINAQILAQEGLATTEDYDEHQSEEEEPPHEDLDESPLGDEDDMVVAQEVDVVYSDEESGSHQASFTDIQVQEPPHEDIIDNSPLGNEDDMVVAQEVDVVYSDEVSGSPQASFTDIHKEIESEAQSQNEAAGAQHSDEELTRVESNRATSPMIPSNVPEKKDSDQDDANQQNAEFKGTGEKFSKQKKKKKKVENRKSTALEAISVEQEKEDTGKSSRNGKSKKQRPKSMPEATLAQADEQELLKDKHVVVPDKVIKSKDSQKPKTKKQPKVNSAPFSDTGPQEVVALTETQPEAKKSKGKKPKEKRVGAESKTEATESPPAKKENSKIKKKKTPASEGTFESPILSTSPPPEEEIRVPKQVTVGVIKMKNTKSRPTLEVEGHARSKAYQSDPDGQAQREDDTDDEERKLLQEMATLQLMADGAAAEAVDETPKKKKQGKVRGPLDKADHEAPAETKVSPKAAKKSKQTKGREKPTVESEPVVAESKESKVMKKTKSKGKAEQQLEVVAQLPPQLETATELDKKQAKKVKKSKNKGKSEPEAEATVQVSPQPEVPTEPEKKERKKVKKTKSIGKSESEAEATVQVSPPQPEVPTEPEKKQPKKVKKTKNKEKVEPMPEPEAQPPQVEEATKADKKESKKAKKTKSKSEPVPEPVAQPPPQDKPKGVPEEKKKASKRVTGKGKAEDTDTGLQTPATTAAVEGNLEDVKPKKTKKKTSKSSVAASDSPSLPQQSPANRGSKSKLATKTSTPKIASETSDDLVFIAADKLSKSKTPTVTSKDDTAVGEEPEAMNLSSSSRSTSYHELSKEDRKTFQEELRKASSQHSVDNSDGERGSIKVEIDPNVKVTKSGVVKGGKGSRRPSLQVDFSGGYEQTDSTSPNESDQGSGGRGNKISVDLSAVPHTTPSLGLNHGHDKLELVNRSSSKRRPMSNRESLLLAQGNEASAAAEDSASSVYQAALAKSKHKDSGGQGTPTSVARQLFPSANGEQSGEGSATSTLERSRRNKTVDKPVKTLGIASEKSSSASSSVPAWVALAKNKQQRSSMLLADKEESKKLDTVLSPSVPVPSSTTSNFGGRQSKDTSIPKMGTVQARLAAFERK